MRSRLGREVDRLVRGLADGERQAVGFIDLRHGQGGDSASGEPGRGVLHQLRGWEGLVVRMEDKAWLQDYFVVDEYLNVLTVRDGIEELLDEMPGSLRGKVERVVRRLDARYRALTFEDGGAELGRYWRPLAEGREHRWWWTRTPVEPPRGW
ncbi:hypothetical protein ACFVH6_10400 [Spirillospora sp. NPDC127200]